MDILINNLLIFKLYFILFFIKLFKMWYLLLNQIKEKKGKKTYGIN